MSTTDTPSDPSAIGTTQMIKDSKETPLSIDGEPRLAKPMRVSELVALLKSDVEKRHRSVRVVGEISSFKQWRSGHCYFDIKDSEALIPAVMFRPHFQRLPFAISDGMSAIFSGRISIYAQNARLQMVVESIEPMGQGALALAFLQLKERLKDEGLFAPDHKRPIGFFNECIGIITSSHGAVLRDMVRMLKTRMSRINILFCAVRVQGVGASQEIERAIDLLDGMMACDVIIVGRGGGSLEDLWPFNDESVARAIFRAKTPIISAVGHETDFSISDFVADVRASTPTHAAALAVPNEQDLVGHLKQSLERLNFLQSANLRKGQLSLSMEKRRLRDPRILLFRHWQQIDECGRKLSDNMEGLLLSHRAKLAEHRDRLWFFAPMRQLNLKSKSLSALREALIRNNPLLAIRSKEEKRADMAHGLNEAMRRRIFYERQGLRTMASRLEALSPLRVLARGYGLLESVDDGRILSKVGDFDIGGSVKIRVWDGTITAEVKGREQSDG